MPLTWHYGARVSDKEKEREDDDEAPEAGEDEPVDAVFDDDDGEGAERAKRVAKALGVAPEDDEASEGAEGTGEAEAEAEAKEEAPPPNRAQRRRDEALARRRKRKGEAAKKAADDALPRDKNKRAKELLARRREAVSAEPSAPSDLDAGEMVDDVLARAWASTTKWLRKNLTMVQYVVAIAIVGVGGFVGYTYFTQKTLGEASSYLAAGAMAERGLIVEKDIEDSEIKELNPTPVFKSIEERQEKALSSYRAVEEKFSGSGAAILAKLGEAGVLLEKREWDKAIETYEAVLKSPLAAVDADVKGRSVEGIAFAKEGKEDIDGALAEVKKLENLDAKGYKELSQYHQARLLLKKGGDEDKTKAKELLKTVYDKLKEPSLDKTPMPYLQPSVEQALKKLDPTLVPDRETLGGSMSPEELQRQLRKIQEDMRNKQNGDPH